MKTTQRYMSTHTLTSGPHASGQIHASAVLHPRRQAHCIKEWNDPRATLDGMEFFLPQTGFEPWFPSPTTAHVIISNVLSTYCL